MAESPVDAQLDPTVNLKDLVNGSPVSYMSGSDDESVNTAEARIHFGPLKSPEKKLAQNIASTPSLRRTQGADPLASKTRVRLPSPSAVHYDNNAAMNEESEDGEEYATQSRSGTPENVRFPLDEPSSILASRIIRAHDNPSPPPRARQTASLAPSPLKDSLVPVIDISDEEDEIITDAPLDYNNLFNPLVSPAPKYVDAPLPPSLTLREASLTPPRDLISFDPTHSLLPSPPPQTAISVPVLSMTAPEALSATVDDFLLRSPSKPPTPRRSRSPSRAPSESNTSSLRPRSTSPTRRSPRLSPAPELSPNDVSGLYDRPSRAEPRTSLPFPEMAIDLSYNITTPRRSPRCSVPPQVVTTGDIQLTSTMPSTSKVPILQTLALPPLVLDPLAPLLETRSSAQTRVKGWKGKSRAVFPGDVEMGSPEPRSLSGSAYMRASPFAEGVEESPKRKHQAEIEKAEVREIGSLSPRSAELLAQLYPSIQATIASDRPATDAQDRDDDQTSPVLPIKADTSNRPTFTSVQRPPPGSPIRLTSPIKNPQSPTKLVTGFNLDDPTRTPARRVPVQHAFNPSSTQKQGFLRPNGGHGLIASVRSPVFTRPLLDDPQRSPAKRVPLSTYASPSKQVKNGAQASRSSPVRAFERERSGSVEPRPFARERSGSVEQRHKPMKLPSTASSSRQAVNLPFPLIATEPNNRRPTVIPEEDEIMTEAAQNLQEPPKASTSTIGSSPKSSLKQPSRSKIPRIGVKPYAKPMINSKDNIKQSGTVGKIGSAKPTSAKPVRLVKLGNGNGSSSDETNIGPSGSSHTVTIKEHSKPTNLKRKRGTEKISPPKPPRPVVIRQVVPGMLAAKYAPSTPPPPMTSTTNFITASIQPSPAKKSQRPITMRKVMDKVPEAKLQPNVMDGQVDQLLSGEDDLEQAEVETITMVPHPIIDDDASSSSPTLPDQSCVQSAETTEKMPPELTILINADEEDTDLSRKVRRTTRARKQAQMPSDIFTTPTARPSQPRQKAHIHRSDTDGFLGLTSVALKALTSSNTAKNQQIFVNLATEVIRRNGNRPESPMVKIRTISQREAEEKVKGRSERAHRRSRRSDEGISDTEGLSSDRGDSSVVEGESEWDELDDNANIQKHRRGPGDEEDYETPVKPARPLEKPRFGSEEPGSPEPQITQEKRSVRWDRGLFSEVFLDEIEVRPQKRLKEEIALKKGCLAPTAKALRLDTLGNIVSADTPLTDLIHENIVVKKFVYENDAEPEAPVVKSTRSKSKRSKS